MHFIHRHFQVPSCKVDLTRFHPKPCLQYHIHRCLGPCVAGADHRRSLRRRGARRAAVPGRPAQRPGARAARAHGGRHPRRCASRKRPALRDLLTTVEEIEERQKMAAAKGDDVDIFALLRRAAAGGAESVPPAQRPDRGPPRVLLGRPGRSSTSRSSSRRCCKQIYLDQQYIPGRDPRAGGVRRSRGAGGTALAKSAAARWRSARRSAARRRRCWAWWRPTRSTASTRASAC